MTLGHDSTGDDGAPAEGDAKRRARRLLTATGLGLALLLLVAIAWAAEPFQPDSFGPGHDARAYWAVSPDEPYMAGVGQESAYLYSPAFLQVVSPLGLLSWTAFLATWTMLLLAVLRWLVGPLLFGPVLLLALPELWGGNIAILMAAGIVVGLRWAGAWALLILTKVTPGLGLLWFLARRDWRSLAWAGVVTLGVAGVSAVVEPDAWGDWFRLLMESTGASTVGHSLPIPLWARLPVAAAVIVSAARTDRRWLLPFGVLLALPIIWWGSFAILAASVALRRHEIEEWLLGQVARRTRANDTEADGARR